MPETLEASLVRLRSPLVAYLRRVGPPSEAEDRFGELALRALSRPPGPEVRDVRAWLFGIARHVAFLPFDRAQSPVELPSPSNLLESLERQALAQVLHSALGRLDEATRRALIEHHGEGIPLAELSVDQGALAARLNRARRRVREGLDAEERAAFATFGVPLPTSRPTEIWCPRCGEGTLEANLPGDADRAFLACPHCAGGELFLAEGGATRLVRGTPRVALNRYLGIAVRGLERWRGNVDARCPRCGTPGSIRTKAGEGHLAYRCAVCSLQTNHQAFQLALASPQGRRFWREHPRIEESRERGELALRSRKSGETLRFRLCARTGCPEI